MYTEIEVDQELDRVESYESKIDSSASAAEIKLINLCGLYHKLRPILKFVRGLLFWKPRWQQVIDQALTAMDETCPTI